KILSPIDGNIISIQGQTGALISKGKVLAVILANGLYEIETDLRSELASKIIIGSEANIINDKTKYKGEVRGMVSSENIRTGTRKVRITLNESLPKSLSASGTRFSLEISVGKSMPRLLIPKDALISSGNKQIVYCFEKGLAKQKFVKVGISVGDKIEILEGLEEGQLVVVKGNENLRPNQLIKIKKLKKK
ncbi:efflux RND transporter periplasmic adaptor subunit, partial [Alphaproteobacteria bacterium]|nr:efflux RND transporter periplasmic adaptor subunit [Alphaproteobacteria bacterium]